MLDCVDCDFTYDENLSECPRCAELENSERPRLIAESAITAQFITNAGNSELESKLGDVWPENDDVCYRLITLVERKFAAKNKFHSYLKEDNSIHSTPSRLKNYIDGTTDFESLVEMFMTELVRAAEDAGAHKISGGNIVFMHYKSHDDDDIGHFLAIMVDKKDGFDFDEQLVPKNTPHINIDAMRQAALFDLTLFDEVYPNIPERDTYLKFIKGNSTGAFFKKAFGCEEGNTDNAESIDQFREAILAFEERYSLGVTFYDNAKRDFELLIEKAERDGIPVSLTKLNNAVDAHIPDNSPVKGTFGTFLNTEGYEVNQHIEPTLNSVKKGQWVDVEALDKSFSGKVVRTRVGKSGSGLPVEYENGRLTFLITSESKQQEFEKLIEANTAND